MELLLSLIVGIILSVTAGFRLFVPLLVLSGTSLAGWVELSDSFAWIGTYPALAALLIATIVEVAAYFIPYIDNLLGAAATPISVLAGALITASVMVEMHPMLTWTLAVVLGGGAALGGSAVSNVVHAGSTAATGGTGNPLVSLFESAAALVLAVMAALVPVLALILLGLLFFFAAKLFRRTGKPRIN
jgi:hypothetical protein